MRIAHSLAGKMGKARGLVAADDVDGRFDINSGDFKRCATLIVIAGVLLGQGFAACTEVRFKPWLLLKGDPKQRHILAERYDPGIHVVWMPKGVVNSRFMREQLFPQLRIEIKQVLPEGGCIATFDCCKAHLTDAVKDCIKECGITMSIIPAGTTSWLQWVDIFFGAAYKQHHFMRWAAEQGKKRTSKQKRHFLAYCCATAVKETLDGGGGVVNQFAKAGYINPLFAEIRGHEYKFVAPMLTPAEILSERNKALGIVDPAPPVPNPPAKRPAPKVKPVMQLGQGVWKSFTSNKKA